MLGETVDKEFTMVEDIAEVAPGAGGVQDQCAHRRKSIIVSHGWP